MNGSLFILAYPPGVDKFLTIGAKAVILGTGGAGALYPRQFNPKRTLANGYMASLQSSAVFQNMKFIQYDHSSTSPNQAQA
jgi:aspartate oxidase